MANKKYLEQRLKAEKEEKLSKGRKKLRVFPLLSLAVALILLLLMLTDWAAVYNTDIEGNEVRISGFNCVAAALSGNYTSSDSAFGNMAVPFNYYAGSFVTTLSVLAAVVMFVVIAHILAQVFATITNKQGAFNVIAILFCVAEAALFIACYAVAISMKNSDILPKYCNNNPACSIHSQAILPGLFAILSLASPIMAMIFETRSKKAIRAAEEAAAARAASAKNNGGKKRK